MDPLTSNAYFYGPPMVPSGLISVITWYFLLILYLFSFQILGTQFVYLFKISSIWKDAGLRTQICISAFFEHCFRKRLVFSDILGIFLGWPELYKVHKFNRLKSQLYSISNKAENLLKSKWCNLMWVKTDLFKICS